MVSGLPESASTSRQWWANSSHSQALAWRAAGYHVEQVYLDRARVRFELGERGGTWHDDHHGLMPPSSRQSSNPAISSTREPIGEPIDLHVSISLQWKAGGEASLDGTGKPVSASLDSIPGLYRMTLTGGGLTRQMVYIGETDNLRRRLSGNYRNPGPRQQTSLRINALPCKHLSTEDGRVAVAIATDAELRITGADQHLDLTRKAGRLLAESAALVVQQIRDDADIANLG